MKQIVYETFGPPPIVTRCVEAANPGEPTAWEVVVKVDAFPINPADLAMIYGQYGILNKPPATIGMEAVGTVIQKGKSVSNLDLGDRVVLLANNNWATLRKIPATLTVKVPPKLDALQCSMLKVSAMTAYHMLTQFEQLKAGQFVIQNAPLSIVGRYTLQIAKILGLKTINLVRRAEQIAEVERLGGDIVLVEDAEVANEVRQRVGNGALKLAIDAVAGESTARLASSLQEGGLIINYGMLSMQPCQIDASNTIFRNVRLVGFWLSKILNRLSAQDRQQQLLQLVDWLGAGLIHGAIDSVYPIESIQDAIKRAEQPGRNGKVLVSTNPADLRLPAGA
ncbi:MAG: zinc-dependent alcohol dehydrogenase family protein [Pirellulales bacterium]